MGRGLALSALSALAALAASRPALAEPSNGALIATGLALAPPTYLVGVSLHEGSHAAMAALLGAHVDTLHLFPPGIDPSTGTFRFGWTYVHGLASPADKIDFYLAPKLTDAALLGGFAALAFTGAWPRSRYGDLALTVFATGLWVDFSKDVVLFAPTNDVEKAFELWGMTGWGQLPARLAYAGAVVGLGLVVAHGYVRTFDRPAPAPAASSGAAAAARQLVLPLIATAF